MKTSRNSLSVLMLIVILCGSSHLQAQGRGRGNGNDNGNKGGNPDRSRDIGNNPGRDHHQEYKEQVHDRNVNTDRDHSQMNNHDRYNNDKGRDHDRFNNHDHNNNWNQDRHSWNDHRYGGYDNHHRYVTYNYHRHNRPSWAPAYGSRYNMRYIYYQDYNVYYDCHRDQFLVWTGRNWVVSNRIPDVMYRVDFGRTRVSGVNYWDDDFDFYLQKRRPAYIDISTNW